jgi:chemotaxis protein MotB
VARKKGGGHGGHGWFVTFADLMALLMSFFVMLAAYSTQDKQKMNMVAGSMRDAFGSQRDKKLSGIVELDGIPTKPNLRNAYVRPLDEASDVTAPNNFKRKEEGLVMTSFDRGFALAASSLRQALQDLPEITEASKNVMIEETKEGLSISIVDQDGRAMFADGSIQPYERTRILIEKMAPVLRRMPNRIAITGHTSARRPGAGRQTLSSWDLSVGRAGAVRDILAEAGASEDRFVSVAGKSDTEPMFPDNPYLPANRRVSIVLLREAPPLPHGAKP